MLNDLSALQDDRNARICAQAGAALLIMHSVGSPKIAHTHVTYQDAIGELLNFFREKISLAERAGVPRDAIVLDPGIDFAKQAADNLRIYRELESLLEFERPILLPVSRKSIIGSVLGISDPCERDPATAACIVAGMLRGASIFRVHNVEMAMARDRIDSAFARGYETRRFRNPAVSGGSLSLFRTGQGFEQRAVCSGACPIYLDSRDLDSSVVDPPALCRNCRRGVDSGATDQNDRRLPGPGIMPRLHHAPWDGRWPTGSS